MPEGNETGRIRGIFRPTSLFPARALPETRRGGCYRSAEGAATPAREETKGRGSPEFSAGPPTWQK